MSRTIRSKIAEHARTEGLTFYESASILGKRSATVRKAKVRKRKFEEENERRFEKMRESRPDLY